MTLLNLKELGSRIAMVDKTIMRLVKSRMGLAGQVGAYKRANGESIFRAEVEDRRIEGVEQLARTLGLNPHFARSLLYLLIGEACKHQMIQLQSDARRAEPQTEEERYEVLRQNLLTLTERWCGTYDESYDKGFFATQACLAFEEDLVRQEVAKLPDLGSDLALDLGCATGRLTCKLGGLFPQAVGYDVSPHMVEVARQRAKDLGLDTGVSFEVMDVEERIPAETESASFVVMNLGTASDVRHIDRVWDEVLRVLKPGGRFLFSFYNQQALLYRWELLPWPTGLAAAINPHQHHLEVHSGDELLSVYARPYTVTEVERLLGAATDLRVLTYPTVSAILPPDLFDESQPDVQEAIVAIDKVLASSALGAYIIATGTKA